MEGFTEFIMNHGYIVVAVWVFVDQIGVPVPAIPVLIAGGALAGSGHLDFTTLLACATLGSLPSDLIWYEAGRRRGGSVLRLLCKISLEPDSCVRKTEQTFVRLGRRSLVFAKFIPGYQILAPPLAGMSGMSIGRFIAYDLPGAVLFCGVFLGLGAVFHDQLDLVYQRATEFGIWLLISVVGTLAGYLLWKFEHRRRFIVSLRTSRIDSTELKGMLDARESVTLFDLRNRLSIDSDPQKIMGAQIVSLEEIDERHSEIPRDREIILYCN